MAFDELRGWTTAGWPLRLLLLTLLLGALAVGLYARLDGFGERPLAMDEFYSATSADFILEHGVPAFAGGGYYVRGPILQYLMAASVAWLGPSELAYRLPALIFALLSILLAYLYARRFLSVPLATAVVVALLLSSWHVEFARFARMYAPFQFFTLLFLLAIDVGFFERWRWRYLPHVAFIPVVLTHNLGILLAPLLLIPLVTHWQRFGSWSARITFAVAGLVVTVLGYLWIDRDVRNLGASARYPADYVAPFNTGYLLPSLPASFGDPVLVLVAVVALLCAAMAIILYLRCGDPYPAIVVVSIGCLIVFSVTRLLTLYALTLAALVLIRLRSSSGDYWRPARLAILGTLVVVLAWLVYGLLAPDSLVTPPATETAGGSALFRWARAFQLTYFAWPDLYSQTLRPFVIYLPLIGLLAALALVYVIVIHARAPLAAGVRLPTTVLVLTSLLLGLFETTSSTTRYWFHLYPVILCLIALALAYLCRRLLSLQNNRAELIAVVGFLGLFALSLDFNPSHLARAGSIEVGLRLGQFERFANGWIPHPDYRGPAEFVNDSDTVHPDAPLLVIHNLPVSHYLKRDHTIYFGRETTDFQLSSSGRGTRELWTDMVLLSTPEELAAYTRAMDELWVIRSASPADQRVDLEKVWAGRDPVLHQVYLSADDRFEVLHVILASTD